jgi:hypothetical protein
MTTSDRGVNSTVPSTYGDDWPSWSRGFAVFAAVMMMTIGVLHVLEGLAAIIRNQFFVVAANYAFHLDVTAWGWLHLILGIVIAIAGFFVIRGVLWARMVGILVAAVSLVANFLSMPYYPFWAFMIIALVAAVIWALCVFHPERGRHG